MSKGFIDETIEGFNQQQINFCNKITGYSLDKVKPADILFIKDDTAYLTWEINTRKAYISSGESWTTFETQIVRAKSSGTVAVAPQLPTIAVEPKAVNMGMRTRFSNIAAECKSSTGYTKAIGIDLGLDGSTAPFVPEDGQPIVTTNLHVGHPFFKYTKGQYEGLQIYKDSGDALGFVKYDKAINPSYTDNAGLPATGVAVKWKYRFVYLHKDTEVGTVSLVTEVLVTGM